jgi:Peptidase inhibitor I66
MSLSTGLYTIRSAAFDRPYVSRSLIEDRSLNPKSILSLPADTNASFLEVNHFSYHRGETEIISYSGMFRTLATADTISGIVERQLP